MYSVQNELACVIVRRISMLVYIITAECGTNISVLLA